MERKESQSKIKPTTAIYLFWLLLGSHYGYMGRWKIQILFWITLGGLGIWAIIDLLNMSDRILKHREMVFNRIEEIENKEKLERTTQYKIESTPGFRIYNNELLFRKNVI